MWLPLRQGAKQACIEVGRQNGAHEPTHHEI
jgi:hypothetical protein